MIVDKITQDAGPNWLKTINTTKHVAKFCSVIDDNKKERLIVGYKDGGINYLMTEADQAWTAGRTDQGSIWDMWVSDLHVAEDKKIYAACNANTGNAAQSDGLWVSGDYGVHWARIYSERGVVSVVTSGNKIFITTRYNGSYVSSDNGQTWTLLDFGIECPCKLSTGRILIRGAYIPEGSTSTKYCIKYTDDAFETINTFDIDTFSSWDKFNMTECINHKVIVTITNSNNGGAGSIYLFSENCATKLGNISTYIVKEPSNLADIYRRPNVLSATMLRTGRILLGATDGVNSNVALDARIGGMYYTDDYGENWVQVKDIGGWGPVYVTQTGKVYISNDQIGLVNYHVHTEATGVYCSTPVFGPDYDNRPLTKQEVLELVAECKAYVQSKKV